MATTRISYEDAAKEDAAEAKKKSTLRDFSIAASMGADNDKLEGLKQSTDYEFGNANVSKTFSSEDSDSARSSNRSVLDSIQSVSSGVSSKQAATELNTAASNVETTVKDRRISLLEEQISNLNDDYRNEKRSINSSYDSAARNLGAQQKSDTAALASNLAYVGGYLGGSASGSIAVTELSIEQQQQKQVLQQRREEALQKAMVAKRDGNLALLKEQNDVITSINAEEAAAIKEQRAFQKEQYNQAKDTLKLLEDGGGDALTLEDTLALDQQLGLPQGFSARYIDVQNAKIQSASNKDSIEFNQKLVNLLQDIPLGEEIEFPDGSIYTGMGDTTDYYFTQATDDKGNVSVVTIDKRTGKILNKETAYGIGKTKTVARASSGGGSASQPSFYNNFSKTEKNLLGNLGIEDPDVATYMVNEGTGFMKWLNNEVIAEVAAEEAGGYYEDALGVTTSVPVGPLQEGEERYQWNMGISDIQVYKSKYEEQNDSAGFESLFN